MGENDRRRAAGCNNTLNFNCTANSTVLELLSLLLIGKGSMLLLRTSPFVSHTRACNKQNITNWVADSSDSLKLGLRSEQEEIAF